MSILKTTVACLVALSLSAPVFAFKIKITTPTNYQLVSDDQDHWSTTDSNTESSNQDSDSNEQTTSEDQDKSNDTHNDQQDESTDSTDQTSTGEDDDSDY